MHRILRFPNFKCKALTISYDDGAIFDKRLVEIMNKHNIKGSFNIPTGFLSQSERYLNLSDLVDLYKGHEIALHGHMHLSLGKISNIEIVKDVLENRRILEKEFNQIITGFAYANGSYTQNAKEILKSIDIRYARTVNRDHAFNLPTDFLEWNVTCAHRDANLFELLDKFLDLKPNSPEKWKLNRNSKLFYLYGHSYEFEDNNNWEIFEKFCAKASNNEDVWYATSSEICSYINAYNSLVYSLDNSLVYNPTATTIYAEFYRKNYVIKPNETVKIEVLPY